MPLPGCTIIISRKIEEMANINFTLKSIQIISQLDSQQIVIIKVASTFENQYNG